jgi:hypothetical protein
MDTTYSKVFSLRSGPTSDEIRFPNITTKFSLCTINCILTFHLQIENVREPHGSQYRSRPEVPQQRGRLRVLFSSRNFPMHLGRTSSPANRQAGTGQI